MHAFLPLLWLIPWRPHTSSCRRQALSGDGPAGMSSLAYFFLRDELGLDEDALLRVMMTCDSALSLSVDRNLRPKMAALADDLGMDLESLARTVGRAPVILTKNKETLLRLSAFLRERLRLSRPQLCRIVTAYPSTMTYGIPGLEEKLKFYEEELGLSPTRLGKLAVAMPSFLGLNVADNVASKVAFFEDDLFLTRQSIAKAVQRCPRLLAASLEETIEPACTLIMETLDLEPYEFSQMFLRYPGILFLDPERKLDVFLDWLGGNRLGCTDRAVRAIVKRVPSLCALSIETLEARADELCAFLGIDDAELRKLVVKFPQVPRALLAPWQALGFFSPFADPTKALSLDATRRLGKLEDLFRQKSVVATRAGTLEGPCRSKLPFQSLTRCGRGRFGRHDSQAALLIGLQGGNAGRENRRHLARSSRSGTGGGCGGGGGGGDENVQCGGACRAADPEKAAPPRSQQEPT
eukprot:scaffold1199_cov265-Pinguiococcus_pyrenoidosus.AAC.40